LTSLGIGQEFLLHGFVSDLRPASGTDPRGVFAAFLDVLFDSNKVQVMGQIVHSSIYATSATGTTTTAGLLDEVGGIAGFDPVGLGPKEVFNIRLKATASGLLVFTAKAADATPSHDTVFYDLSGPTANPNVSDAESHFGTTSIQVAGTFD